MSGYAVAWILGAVVGWLAHDLYKNGVEHQVDLRKPLNQRGARLRWFR